MKQNKHQAKPVEVTQAQPSAPKPVERDCIYCEVELQGGTRFYRPFIMQDGVARNLCDWTSKDDAGSQMISAIYDLLTK